MSGTFGSTPLQSCRSIARSRNAKWISAKRPTSASAPSPDGSKPVRPHTSNIDNVATRPWSKAFSLRGHSNDRNAPWKKKKKTKTPLRTPPFCPLHCRLNKQTTKQQASMTGSQNLEKNTKCCELAGRIVMDNTRADVLQVLAALFALRSKHRRLTKNCASWVIGIITSTDPLSARKGEQKNTFLNSKAAHLFVQAGFIFAAV